MEFTGMNLRVPSAGDLMAKLEAAARVLREARARGSIELGGVPVRVHNGVWVVEEEGLGGRGVTVVGDVHGDLATLYAAITLGLTSLVVFVGDYVDRGPPEGQVLTLYTIASLIEQGAPIVPLRGNHEPPEGLLPFPHDYPDALAHLYGPEAESLYSASKELFDALPYALIIESSGTSTMTSKVLIVHAGPPANKFASGDVPNSLVELLEGDREKPSRELLEEVLWNDPLDDGPETMPIPNNRRGAGYLWPKTVTFKLSTRYNIKRIIRGHEWKIRGYDITHHGIVVTLFSRVGEPYPNEAAAILYCRDPRVLFTAKDENTIRRCITRLVPKREPAMLASYSY